MEILTQLSSAVWNIKVCVVSYKNVKNPWVSTGWLHAYMQKRAYMKPSSSSSFSAFILGDFQFQFTAWEHG